MYYIGEHENHVSTSLNLIRMFDKITFAGDTVNMFRVFNSKFNKSLSMKWYFLFRIQHAGHNGITKTHHFTTWSDVFNIPSELRLLQVTVKTYCSYMFFFSAIKTRNSTLKFVFLFWSRALRSKSCVFHTLKFKLLRRM